MPGRYLEYFMEESWLEHLRHHERVTESDRIAQELVHAHHLDEDRPRVSHFLAPASPADAAVRPLTGETRTK